MFIPCFLLLLSNIVFSEELDVKREYWVKYIVWGKGNLKNETHFKNGKKEGPTKYWYKSGKLKVKDISKMEYKTDYYYGGLSLAKRWLKNITRMGKSMVLRLGGMTTERKSLKNITKTEV